MLNRRTNRSCLIAFASLGFANIGAAQPVATVSYEVPSNVSLHEPIPVLMTIRADSEVKADLGWNQVGHLRFGVTKPDGSEIAFQPWIREGTARPSDVSIAANETFSRWVLMDEWMPLTDVGIYRLTLTFNGSVRSAQGKAVDVERTKIVQITVLPRDAAKLRSLCDDLLRAASQPKASGLPTEVELKDRAVATLAYVNDPVAIPYLRKVMEYEKSSAGLLGLARIGTPAARRVLEDFYHGDDPEIAEMALDILRRMSTGSIR